MSPVTSPVRRRPVAGFTLVELLVVIGIIAVLVSILLPALNRVRAQAIGVNCLSNLRQNGVAFRMYAEANKGWLPSSRAYQFVNPGSGTGPIVSLRPAETWPDLLMETRFLPDIRDKEQIERFGDGTVSESVVKWPNAFSCPAFGAPEIGFTGGTGKVYPAGVTTTRFAYGMRISDQDFKRRNGAVEQWSLLDGRAVRDVPGVNGTFGGMVAKLDNIAQDIPILADSIIVNASFNTFSQPDTFQTRFPNAFNTYIHRRHNKKANCLFIDGSAYPLGRREMLALRTVFNQPIYSFPTTDNPNP